MKWLLVGMLIAGCSGKDRLQADVEMFCSATVGTTFKRFVDVGPYVAEHAKTDELKQLLAQPARGTMDIWQFADKVRELMKKTGVARCETLDVIVPPRRSE